MCKGQISGDRTKTAWDDTARLGLDPEPLKENAARLLLALRALVLQALQSGVVFERDSIVPEARAAILAAQGGKVLS